LRSLADGTKVAVLDGEGHRLLGRHVATSDIIASSSAALDSVLIWALPKPDPWESAAAGGVTTVALSSDGQLVAGSTSSDLVVWDSRSATALGAWPLHSAAARTVLSGDGRAAGTVSQRSALAVVVDLMTGQARDVPVGLEAMSLAIDGQRTYVGYRDGSVRGFRGVEPMWAYEASSLADRDIWDLALDGDRVWVSIHTPGRVFALDAMTGEVEHVWQAPSETYKMSIHGSALAVGTYNDSAWVMVGSDLRQLPPHSGPVLDVAFSPNGQFLATTDYDSNLRFFDLDALDPAVYVDGTHQRFVGRTWWPQDDVIFSAGDAPGFVRRDLRLHDAMRVSHDAMAAHAAGVELARSEWAAIARTLSHRGLVHYTGDAHGRGDGPAAERLRDAWLAGDLPSARAALSEGGMSPAFTALWSRRLDEPSDPPP
jgi:WD40 repeat protein